MPANESIADLSAEVAPAAQEIRAATGTAVSRIEKHRKRESDQRSRA
jgi:hypothetical protein